MFRFVKLPVTVVLLMLQTPLYASDWRLVYEDDEEFEWVDVESLTRDGNVILAWTRVRYKEPQDDYGRLGQFRSSTASWLVNCKARRMAIKSEVVWVNPDFKGDAIDHWEKADSELEWFDLAPDAPGEMLLKIVCKNAPPK